MKYLEYKADIDKVTRIDKKSIHKSYDYSEEIELGYADGIQQDALSSNAENIKMRCVVSRDWDELL